MSTESYDGSSLPAYEIFVPETSCSHNVEVAGLVNRFRALQAEELARQGRLEESLGTLRLGVIELDDTLRRASANASGPEAAKAGLLIATTNEQLGNAIAGIAQTETIIGEIQATTVSCDNNINAAMSVIARHDAAYHANGGSCE